MTEFDGEVVINTRMNSTEAENGAETINAAMQSVVQAIESAGKSLNATLHQIGGNLNDMSEFMVGFAEGLSDGLSEAMSQATNTGNVVQSTTQRVAASADSASSHIQDLAYSFVSAANATTRFGSGAVYALKNVIGYAKNVKSYINGTKESIQNSAKGMVDMAKRTAMMMLGIRGVYMIFRKLMTAFTTGAKSLAAYSDTFNRAMSNITNSMNQVKYNIAAAVAPAIEALEPIITSLFDKINAGLNKVAEFMAAITGKGTYQKAIKQANSYAKAQTDAAKASQNSLNALEELNVIGKDENGNATQSGPLYETAMVSEAVSELGKKWRELFKSGNFREIGKQVGLLAKSLDKIPWKKVSDSARTLGFNIAEFSNGLIQSGGLTSIGNALGQWENQIGYLMGGFIDDFEWEKNGKSIGEALVAYMLPTDWEQFRHNALEMWKGIAKLLNSIIETDGLWENIGTTIAGKILVAIESWYGWATEFHFDSLGEGIAKAINQFFDDMAQENKETGKNGWEELGESITATADGLVVALSKALEDTDWVQIGDAIGTLMASIDWLRFLKDLKDCAWNLLKAIAQGFSAWAEKDPISAAIVGILGAQMVLSKFTTVGNKIGGSLLSGIGLKLGVAAGAGYAGFKLGTWLGKLFWPDDADLYDDLNLETVCEAIVTLEERIGEKFQLLFNTVLGWVKTISDKIAGFFNDVDIMINGDSKSGAKNFIGWILDGMPSEAEVADGGGRSGGGADFGTPAAGHYGGGASYSGETTYERLRRLYPGAATGAVIPRTANEHLVRVGDNNTETEVISPLSTMKQAMVEALAEANIGNGEQRISLSIDGQHMFEWLVQKNKDTFMRTHQNQLMY